MCKHEPKWLYPTRDIVPDKYKYLALAISNPFLSYVYCEKCGMTGHAIRSRRGGIRWHRNHTPEDRQRIYDRAAQFWQGCDLEAPRLSF